MNKEEGEGVGWVGVNTVTIVVVSSVQGKHMPSAGGSPSLSLCLSLKIL